MVQVKLMVKYLLAARLSACAAELCAGDSDAPSCATSGHDTASLLQVQALQALQEAPDPYYTWKFSQRPGEAARTCDEICGEYGSVCVRDGFKEVKSRSRVQTAHRKAKGAFCRAGLLPTKSKASFAPYVDQNEACVYPSDVSRSTCSSMPTSSSYSRLCPCTASPTPPQCVQLKGMYCEGRDLQCDCRYCDDFKSNSRCANACRVLNGHRASPIRGVFWEAPRNQRPSDTGSCACSWMASNNGRGDDCTRCDTCAQKCRRQNPGGTCR